MNRIAIYGAGGHGKVVAELVELAGYNQVFFFDEQWPSVTLNKHWPLIGDFDSLVETINDYDGVVVAIGNNRARLEKTNYLIKIGAPLKTFIHPTAYISRYSEIGLGSVIMAHAVVNPFVTIGNAVIINTAATIDHDSILNDGVHICPGVHLAGAVYVGNEVMIGIGAQVIQGINIEFRATVGAGANVLLDVEPHTTVVGNPAKLISQKG
ncbi:MULTISPECIES: acetyltransferase [Citrobacter freundii complex]|uniref:acetyltransferase n=1 Tax=Citrobacter freundii complex TaxID=1344959 RepID=UPI000CCFEF69|nr:MULTISPECIES: acetyltransferase [Citrobacter freundii complex]MBA7977910.1 acetyltransferase [Citrobacter freundii]AUV44352.1 acetyltransferase [Citrobacter freundii complex sp. CFNIH9]MCW8354255.1 acetyltransferase [Citrobacter portucalensis]MCX8971806.1 acetyltransferase [Citrobacter portucalensis]MCX8995206.1 acetyltransferase [Citrobacter portucalensis]